MTRAKNEVELLFSEAVKSWNLEKLYLELDNLNFQSNKQPLTILEKACLRGLLCGRAPQEIARELGTEAEDVILNIIDRKSVV